MQLAALNDDGKQVAPLPGRFTSGRRLLFDENFRVGSHTICDASSDCRATADPDRDPIRLCGSSGTTAAAADQAGVSVAA